MILTKEEEGMLKGEFGYGAQKAMNILVSLGEIYGAEKMAKIGSAHLPGVGATSAKDAGISFVEEMYEGGARFKTWTTLNVAAIDFENWEKIGISEEIVEKQMKLTEIFRKMGAVPNHTCTPYFGLSLPGMNEHVAWGDSGALLLANSFFGARTNREGGPSALAAAITGRVPVFGLHLEENRCGHFPIEVNTQLNSLADFSALGFCVGKQIKKGVPVFTNLSSETSFDKLMALTSLPTGGSIALFHILGVTPEAKTLEQILPKGKSGNVIVISEKDITRTTEELNTGKGDPCLVVLGCPHASIQQVIYFSKLLDGKKLNTNTRLWICTSMAVKSMADKIGCTDIIEKTGAMIVTDTCPVQLTYDFYQSENIHCITTDSAALIHYMSAYHGKLGLQSHFGSEERCIQAAIRGKWEEM